MTQQQILHSEKKDWRRYVKYFEQEIKKAGLDNALEVFPTMLAKEYTNSVEDNKGFCIMGNIGCGKTKRMLLFSKLFWIKPVIAEILCGIISERNTEQSFLELTKSEIISGFQYGERDLDLFIDELGDEDKEKVSFGNRRDIMIRVLERRYNMWRYNGGHKTHFTTNLSHEMLEQRYGKRVYSRLCEMVHFIVMSGEDRRRK